MNQDLNWWIELAIRWTHVFAGIMWVGATYYFTWLDGRFVELEEKAEKIPTTKTPRNSSGWSIAAVFISSKRSNSRS
jgi:uncharacterized membrane protein